MKKNFNKAGLTLTIVCAFILLIEYLFITFFKGWTFKTGNLVIANNILSYFAFFGVIFFGLYTFKPRAAFTFVLGFIFLLLFALLTALTINPIDTTTQPVDLKIIQTHPDGRKNVVRGYKNAKTNREILDTVLVEDAFIFRKILLE